MPLNYIINQVTCENFFITFRITIDSRTSPRNDISTRI